MASPSQRGSMDSIKQAEAKKTRLRSSEAEQHGALQALHIRDSASLQYYRHARALEGLERGGSTVVVLAIPGTRRHRKSC